VATAFLNTLDHQAIARTVLNRFENIVERLQSRGLLTAGYLPVYGLGHSLGCKIHLLIGSFYDVERAGNILISFNNYPVKQAIPLAEQLAQFDLQGLVNTVKEQLEVKSDLNVDLNWEFTPTPEETNRLIAEHYT
ncbi:MAG: DUF1350 family protein, partial [Microcystaceae cyanobacterium]